jgi:hypothetical protein
MSTQVFNFAYLCFLSISSLGCAANYLQAYPFIISQSHLPSQMMKHFVIAVYA